MDELAKISRVISRELPGADIETLLVLDATMGQNAVNQAREFKNSADITGIILTKLDSSSKGGMVISVRRELGIPIKFIGVGEKIDDMEPFDAHEFARAFVDAE
jgi:fused signal recognition particle receptor